MKKGKKIEVKENPSSSSSYNDERFAHIENNPIFRRVPAKEKRIDVDERFHSMFHDSKFNLNSKVDKRGKPITAKSDKRLSTYYTAVGIEKKENVTQKSKKKLRSQDQDYSEEPPNETKTVLSKEEKSSPDSSTNEEDSSSDSDCEDLTKKNDINLGKYNSTLTADIKKKLHDANIDYARGDHVFASEESSSEDSSDGEEEDEDLMHEWGEIDKDAPRTENATSRLALCNMDWDNLRAVDLLLLFNSFVPAEGVLKCVSIYPSEFGKERMAEEDINGPKELSETVINESDEQSGNEYEEDDVNEYHMEKLRKYQLNRLKYFYAVLQFDSAETAEKVYSECDGMEFESSATRIDLRFIPEDMTFEDEPKDKCDQLPEADKYRPRFFTTTALQQIKVGLTWDETDPMRKELTEMVFDPKANVDDEDLVAYLASSSSESEEEPDAEEKAKELEKSSQKDRLAKYRSLLEGIEEGKSKEKESDVQMEITWGIGLKKKTEELVKKKNEEKIAKDRTPWEEMLAKQKDKKKQKRKEKIKKASQDSEESDKPFSDDEVDVDLNDDFFKNEIPSNSKKREKNNKSDDTTPDEEANKAALELLMMDDDDNKSHFSLKKIMADSEEKGKKKRKGKKNKEKEPKNIDDNFEINVNDDRFSALFSSHHFNVDPSDPNYKKTKGMEKIISEKLKRRPQMLKNKNIEEKDSSAGFEDGVAHKSEQDNSSKEKFELQSLVKSIKRKAENMKNVAKQKRVK